MEGLSINIPSNQKDYSRSMTKKILKNSMDNMISSLKYLETPACRKLLSKETITQQRRDVTFKFKNLIMVLDGLT
jgi:hypothetical protein